MYRVPRLRHPSAERKPARRAFPEGLAGTLPVHPLWPGGHPYHRPFLCCHSPAKGSATHRGCGSCWGGWPVPTTHHGCGSPHHKGLLTSGGPTSQSFEGREVSPERPRAPSGLAVGLMFLARGRHRQGLLAVPPEGPCWRERPCTLQEPALLMAVRILWHPEP